MTSPTDLLRLAEETAREAGRLVLEGGQSRVEVTGTKSSPTDVVTAVDLASERLIRERIAAARPADAVVGEEGDDSSGSSGVTWVVDPIDGTVNFLYGIRQFSVSLAACDEAGAVAAVVHDPSSGETFTALRGDGAWLDGRPIRPSDCTDTTRALVGTGYHYRADVRARQAVETGRLVPHIRDVRRMGSAALDLCYVACGRYDAYVERGLRPWDLAGGELIAREAGVRVEGMHGSDPSELLVVAAPEALFEGLHRELVSAGFGDWPIPDWPPNHRDV
ncbi:MAG: inositol monophosphatase [Propionibacteriales bacterium]|nr:inositol monophosphatase [Propionibacteriales bacterium]